jgi:hypothetical protein
MNSPPYFPQTRPIVLEDKVLCSPLFKQYPPLISEFTFTNLFAWRRAYQFAVSQLDGFLLIISLKNAAFQIFDPLGPFKKKREVIQKCFALGKEQPIRFLRLPEETVALFKKDASFKIEEDRDDFDYVYLTSDLIGLKGKNFDAKRNFIKRFKEAYVFNYKKLTVENIKECLFFQEEWCLAKDCQRTEGLAKEKEAMQEMLAHFEALGVAGGMIEVNGKVEAVALGEMLNPETFVVHVEKANGSLIGIYQTINQAFCAAEASRYKYANREQDLGVVGLRRAKESYHPCAMIKKYSLTLKAMTQR